jgi:hypothetical protein
LDIYYKKRRWKLAIFFFAVLIGIGSLLYTNNLVKKTSIEEHDKIERWAEAIRILVNNEDLGSDVNLFLNEILRSNTTIPLILVDKNDEINTDRNINYTKKNRDKVLSRKLSIMKSRQKPIVIPLGKNDEQYLYYEESTLLVQLRYYPILQLGVLILFILAAYVAFNSARNTEQNLVWIGMAKETAHQLGTPISSLLAWVELLKEENIDQSIVQELDKDTLRLINITERFSKVGSHPELYPCDLYQQLLNTISYLESRISKKIKIETNFDQNNTLHLPLSSTLFSWVIENLIKNSIDSIENINGHILINVQEREKDVFIDLTDNGKGLPKSKFKTIFQPGYTTKKRGWGLGLSLSKRIIENYHKGKIFLKSSEPKKPPPFRII